MVFLPFINPDRIGRGAALRVLPQNATSRTSLRQFVLEMWATSEYILCAGTPTARPYWPAMFMQVQVGKYATVSPGHRGGRVIEIIHLMVICHRVTLVLLLKAIIKNKHLYEGRHKRESFKKNQCQLCIS